MKTTRLFLLASAMVTSTTSMPLELAAVTSVSNLTSSNIVGSMSKTSAACEWNDGIGPVGCDRWSIVFGDNSIVGHPNKITIKANNFEVSKVLDCNNENFQDFNTPLPYVISIHPGNTCKNKFVGMSYDNTWIKYASMFVNLPADTRCGPVYQLDKGFRCLLPQRP